MSIATVMDKSIKVHPLSLQPDKCYMEETKKGRYKNLQPVDANSLYSTERKPNTVRFVCISDTHSKTDTLHHDIPAGDVLIHAGDFTAICTKEEVVGFTKFLEELQGKFKHVVVIAGNHEFSFDQQSWSRRGSKVSMYQAFFARSLPSEQLTPVEAKQLLSGCSYIEDETITLYGINIFGSPWQPPHYDLAFNELRGERLLKKWNTIPEDTDILITHGPPLGIGDMTKRGLHVGCSELLSTVMDRVVPKYHVFGHVHEGYGIWGDGSTTFINASVCDKKYNPVNKPVVFDYHMHSEGLPTTITDSSNE